MQHGTVAAVRLRSPPLPRQPVLHCRGGRGRPPPTPPAVAGAQRRVPAPAADRARPRAAPAQALQRLRRLQLREGSGTAAMEETAALLALQVARRAPARRAAARAAPLLPPNSPRSISRQDAPCDDASLEAAPTPAAPAPAPAPAPAAARAPAPRQSDSGAGRRRLTRPRGGRTE